PVGAIEAPTGSGKTIAYLSCLSSERTLVSVHTKALQEQVKKEAHKLNLEASTIKGKNNYVCPLLEEKTSNKLPPPSFCKPACPKASSCEYMLAKNSNAQIHIVNHALLNFIKHNYDTCIIDEAHELSINQMRISKDDLNELKNIEAYKEQLKDIEDQLDRDFIPFTDSFLSKIKMFFRSSVDRNLVILYTELAKKFKRLESIQKALESNHYLFETSSDVILTSLPKLPNTPKLFLFSATLNRLLLNLMGFTYPVLEIPKVFDWSKVKIVVKDTHYREPNYLQVLSDSYRYLRSAYDKTIVLATSVDQLGFFEKLDQSLLTQKNFTASELAEKLINGNTQAIAGVLSLWTGIDIPGRKAILITKLPYENPSSEESRAKQEFLKKLGVDPFEWSTQEALIKFKQGIGRMMRTPEDEGEIIIADRRALKEPFKSFLESLGANLVFDK
ncbi:MAG: helicase C-terminal domain-containing protein, partial [Candidatus Aenigmatarchaeota archaeon]